MSRPIIINGNVIIAWGGNNIIGNGNQIVGNNSNGNAIYSNAVLIQKIKGLEALLKEKDRQLEILQHENKMLLRCQNLQTIGKDSEHHQNQSNGNG